MTKRVFDLIISALGIIALLPVLAVIALAVKKEDRGPVLYNGLRIGFNGKPFRMHKFRTMVLNADKIGGSSSADDDPRITRTGKKLRKYKLDELPQLFNVLKGEMSFVGPRPEVPFYVNMFTEQEKQILTVRPGITDWASLWNSDEGSILAGSPDPEKTYLEKIRPEKIKLQLKYVQERSLFTDFTIIIKTLLKIIGH
jgi:lipopolysaccharide/colanic/teichoic acid biosynthesis glycosyltransferase